MSTRRPESSLRVFARIRPDLDDEIYRESLLSSEPPANIKVAMSISEGKKEMNFSFDGVLETGESQQSLYEAINATGIIDGVIGGNDAMIMAFGSTGSGKTYTIEGDANDADKVGLLPRCLSYLFEELQKLNNEGLGFIVKMTSCQVYQAKVYDLLAEKDISPLESPLRVRWNVADDFFVENLKRVEVRDLTQALRCARQSSKNRVVSARSLNVSSSRSHSLTKVTISSSSATQLSSSITFVDLAGSERFDKGHNAPKETIAINRSLLVLRQVLTALSRRSRHVPFRDSVLTRLLQPSLKGQCINTLIACVSGCDLHINETLRTLRYGARARKIVRQRYTKRGRQKDGLIRQLKDEIRHLKSEIRNSPKDPNLQNSLQMVTNERNELVQKNEVLVKQNNALRVHIDALGEALQSIEDVYDLDTRSIASASSNVSREMTDSIQESCVDDQIYSGTPRELEGSPVDIMFLGTPESIQDLRQKAFSEFEEAHVRVRERQDLLEPHIAGGVAINFNGDYRMNECADEATERIMHEEVRGKKHRPKLANSSAAETVCTIDVRPYEMPPLNIESATRALKQSKPYPGHKGSISQRDGAMYGDLTHMDKLFAILQPPPPSERKSSKKVSKSRRKRLQLPNRVRSSIFQSH